MTLISRLVFFNNKRQIKEYPLDKIELNETSIVIPVKDNREGIENYLHALFETHQNGNLPKEVIIVDNNSAIPISIKQWEKKGNFAIRLLQCSKQGAAAARNMGAKHAVGKWVLFNDSDCIPTSSLLTGYLNAENGSVAYAGNVLSLGNDRLSRYYESQEILVPLKVYDDERGFVPQYLITANCLIWRDALLRVKGFDERFTVAGGEDIDLGLRLSRLGHLAYAYDSVIMHNFDDGIVGFCKRFKRYGKGNKMVEEIWDVKMTPKPFKPNAPSLHNWLLALLQYFHLLVGYRQGG